MNNAEQIQVLVKLDQVKTFVLNFDKPVLISDNLILQRLSSLSHVPQQMLRLHPSKSLVSNFISDEESVSFRSAYTFFPILGGKGGFGTLLKGQSKQAGARQTTDFGACRDLNGRRLRHVNDEIKLRKWRETMAQRMKSGSEIDVEAEFAALKTDSGIRNWHLMTPNWGAGEMTNKMKRKMEMSMKREIQRWAREVKEEQESQKEKKRAFEESVLDYSKMGRERQLKEDEALLSSIQEGLRKKRRMRERNPVDAAKDDDDIEEGLDPFFVSSSYICTLSGDIIIEEDKNQNGCFMVQSKSEFATAVVMLDKKKFFSKSCEKIYYEITIETAGIAQIGWAQIDTNTDALSIQLDDNTGFCPNSDSGDGVGDDEFSYSMDGLRGVKFHCGRDEKYEQPNGGTSWKKGDVIGCIYDLESKSLKYTWNGKDMGLAFTLKSTPVLLYPAFSLNENEILKVNIGPSFAYGANEWTAVNSLIQDQSVQKVSDGIDMNDGVSSRSEVSSSLNQYEIKDDSAVKENSTVKKSLLPAIEIKMTTPKCFDLNTIDSVEELEAFGMDELKAILFSLGLKCGGNLKERAQRLFSIKCFEKNDIPEKLRGKNFSSVKDWDAKNMADWKY